jgi:hypothetical protein
MSATRLRLLGSDQTGCGSSERPAAYTVSETIVLLLAGVAFTGGLVHVGAAVDHFGEFPLYTLVFAGLATVQMAWAAMLVWRPSHRVLLFGCAFNVAVIGLWIASRTSGVPIAPRAWVPEAVGVADVIDTASEAIAVITAISLVMSARLPLAQRVTERMAPVLLAVLLVSVLYGVGAHAG